MNEESIFAAALAKKTPQERAAYLDEACQGNAALRAQVDELIAASAAAGSFFEHPPAGLDATIEATANHETHKSAQWDGSLAFLKPCDQPGRIGKLVGNTGEYEIIEVVGHGGMGIVLRAFDTKLSRVVAVKVLAPELARNPTAVKRFLREAKAAAAVVHDHVVTIHNVEETHQPPFLVMQYVEGQTLQQKIDRQGALELKEILRIGCQAAAGLAAAHKHGLVHRDVKPANILLENGVERVKITDFGLARAADDVEITQTGLIAGTPQYMSPEQATGEPLDARSDLFSLGSVLYSMCTGRPAFRADSTVGILRRVCDDEPRPIHEVNAELPPWLAGIVSKLLAKKPADRYQSAAEVSELLGQCLAHVQNPASAPLPVAAAVKESNLRHSLVKRSSAPLTLAMVLLLVIGLGIAVLSAMAISASIAWYFHHEREVETATVTLLVAKPTVEVTFNGEKVAVTDEGKATFQVAPGTYHIQTIVRGMPARMDIASLRPGGQEVRRIRDDAGAVYIEGPLSSEEVLRRLAESSPPLTNDWIQLFNGQDLTGWQAIPPQNWQVRDGVIHGTGPDGFLVHDVSDFEDFHLLVEFRINEAGDAGVHFRVPTPEQQSGTMWGYKVVGLEAEIGVRKSAGYRTGALTTKDPNSQVLAFAPTDAVHRADEWTRLEIIAQGERIQILVNGALVTDYADTAGKFRRGHIALASWEDAHIETRVEFRRVEIRRPDDDTPPLVQSHGQDLDRTPAEKIKLPVGSSADVLTSPDWEWSAPENLGPLINTAATEGGPTISGDGLTLVFHSDRDGGLGGNDLWHCTRNTVDDPWGTPVNLGPDVNSTAIDSDAALSADGLALVFHSNRPGGQGNHDLWMSTRADPSQPWSAAVNLSAVNSGAGEMAPTLSADGLSLIFNSSRPGKNGESDLWFSTRPTPKAPWSPPQNLGRQINSPNFQGFAALASDGLSLIFNSNRDGGPWSGPLCISTRTSAQGEWSEPRRLWNDSFGAWSACLSADAHTMLFDSKRQRGQGGFDLWMTRRVRKSSASAAQDNPKDQWVQLFNGQDLAHWKKIPDQPGGWVVEDGVLSGRGRPETGKRGGDPAPNLVSQRSDYGDFHLRAEMMLDERADGSLFFRAIMPPDSRGESEPEDPTGYQIQFAGGKLGCLAGLSTEYQEIKPGEWFTLEVIAQGKQLTIKVNGQVTADVQDDAHQRGALVIQSLDPEGVVKFRKIELQELQATDAAGIIWGPVKDSWQVGIGWKDGKTKYAASEQPEFELKVRNATDAETTIHFDMPTGWDLWYFGGDELSLRIFGRDEQELKLAARAEAILDVPKPRMNLEGLSAGKYRLKVTTDVGDKEQQPAETLDFTYEGPAEQPLSPPPPMPLEHSDAKYVKVVWGAPLLGLSLGIRQAAGDNPGRPSGPQLEFLLWNVGPSEAEVEYLDHHALDWQLFFRDGEGKEFRSEPVLTGPKVQLTKKLAAGEVLPLGTTIMNRQAAGIPAAGPYQIWSKFNCRRLDYGHLNLQLTSGEASVEVKP